MDQGLPVNFENTAGTWQNMPGMAALYTGLQNQAAQDNIRMLQEAFAKEQAFKDQQRPIELQNLIATGDLTRANALYNGAQARLSGLDADFAQATMPGKVASTNAKYQNEVDLSPVEKFLAQGKAFGALSAYVADPSIPTFMKLQKIKEVTGMEDPERLLPMLPKLPQVFKAHSDFAFQQSDAAKLEAMKNTSAEKVANIHSAATVNAAQIGADSREEVQRLKNQDKANATLEAVKAGKMGFEKAATTFTVLADLEPDEKMAAKYRELASQFEKANINQKTAQSQGKVDVGATTGLPTQQVPTVLGGTPASAPAKKHSLADVQKMYPGVPADKLKQAYKEKFGVDLQ